MMWLRFSPRAVAVMALSAVLIVPAYGESSGGNAPAKPSDGLTRDTFAEPGTPPRSPAPAPSAPRPRAHTKRTRLDSKDFLSVHHTTRRHRTHEKPRTEVAAVTRAPKRRNPVTSFVYWWNGFVIKTFHTKVGTVMLGTVGAKS